jgi:transcriptional regulator with XRE-family HTH domain
MTPDWKAAVHTKRKEKKWTQKRLAAEAGCGQSNISQALDEHQHTSQYVEAISEALQIPLPSFAGSSELLRRAIRAMLVLEASRPEFLEHEVRALELLVADTNKEADLSAPTPSVIDPTATTKRSQKS